MKLIKNKGFTLIELLVTIAVLSILVLLGIPRFLGYTQKAELTRIQHDVKTMEQEVGTVLISNDDDINKWESNSRDFNQLIQENKFFKREGAVNRVEDLSTDTTYKVIPEKLSKKINTKLKGTFYADSGGKVYYEHVKSIKSGEKEPESSDEKIQKLIEEEGYIPIATAEELDSIRDTSTRTYGEGTDWEKESTAGGLDKKYVQVANIDLSGYSKEEGWAPIGTLGASFTGSYDGNGYNITGLTISRPETDYVGLFGHTKGAIIRNVGLIDNTVTGGNWVGGLVGRAVQNTNISNSYATGSVTGNHEAGDTGSVNNDVGGLVGHASYSMIENSYATGSVKGSGYSVGGLVGDTHTSNISNSYATGSVTGLGEVGGIVGWARKTTIENSYATGSVTSPGEVGGIVGRAIGGTKISNSYATGSVTGSENDAGGLVGRAVDSNTVTKSYWDKDTTGQSSSAAGGTGRTTKEMKNRAAYSGWNFNIVWKIDEGNDYPKLR